MRQGLVQFSLIEEPFFGLERSGEDNPDLPAVGPINTEDACACNRDAEVKKPGLGREPRGIGQQANREGIFERFFDFLQSQRTIEIEGRIIPIKLHRGLIVYRMPMQCLYNVFTHGNDFVNRISLRSAGFGPNRELNCGVERLVIDELMG
jgi:hypothetical protein